MATEFREGDAIQLTPIRGVIVEIYESSLHSWKRTGLRGKKPGRKPGALMMKVKLEDGRELTLGNSQLRQIQHIEEQEG